MKAAILILSLILCITVKVNGLQCYVCYDCATVTDDSLLSCEEYASNSTTTTTESATNSSSTTTSTTTPSTTTPTSTTSSTTTPTTTSSTTTPTTTTSSTTTPTTTTSSTTTPTTTTSTAAPDTNATDTNDTLQVEANMMYKIVERADSYECMSGTINVGNTTVTVRGCVTNPTNNTCALSGLSDCTLCSTDKCNGATAVHSSAALLCLLFLYLLYNE